jgi:hypothetical protein
LFVKSAVNNLIQDGRDFTVKRPQRRPNLSAQAIVSEHSVECRRKDTKTRIIQKLLGIGPTNTNKRTQNQLIDEDWIKKHRYRPAVKKMDPNQQVNVGGAGFYLWTVLKES